MHLTTKILISCAVLGAIFGGLLAAQTKPVSHSTVARPSDPDRNIFFVGGSSGHWLTVSRTNTKDYEQSGFNPSYTSVISDFRPIVSRKGQQWEITFTSEIAKDLP